MPNKTFPIPATVRILLLAIAALACGACAGRNSHRAELAGLDPITTVTVSLDRQVPFRGIVRDRMGNPIAGARVRAADLERPDPAVAPEYQTRTDAEGRFTLLIPARETPRLSSYDIFVDGPGHAAFAGPFRAGAFTLVPGAAHSGRVLDSFGNPVEEAEVRLLPARGEESITSVTLTDPEGRYRFDSAPADQPFALVAYRNGVGVAYAEATPDTVGELILRDDGLTLRGEVRSSRGWPILGVEVSAFPPASTSPKRASEVARRSLSTIATGSAFALGPLPIETFDVYFSTSPELFGPQGALIQHSNLRMRAEGNNRLNLTSGGPLTVTGRAFDVATGEAVQGVAMYLMAPRLKRLSGATRQTPVHWHAALASSFVTNQEGQYVLFCDPFLFNPTLGHGEFRMRVEPPRGWYHLGGAGAGLSRTGPEVRHGARLTIDVPLVRSTTLFGVVTNAVGQPVAGARVEWSPGAGREGAAVTYTDEEGEFELPIAADVEGTVAIEDFEWGRFSRTFVSDIEATQTGLRVTLPGIEAEGSRDR